jgi:hydroxymethylglutaryl-CoA reductase (NADPH)
MVSMNGRPESLQHWSEEARTERLKMLRRHSGLALANLALPLEESETLHGQIENYVGVVRVPVGIAGPLAVRGCAAVGTFHVPLATTEGTLVLAVARGAETITAAGGALVHASEPEVVRAPLFVFADGSRARAAAAWVSEHVESIRAEAESTTRHGRLLAIEPVLFGRRLVLRFVYSTGDAAGQNLVTLATHAACSWLRRQPPFAGLELYTLESNLSHDKKLATISVAGRRGRRVDAEVTIPRAEVTRILHIAPEDMARVAREGVYACAISGAVGAQAQFANVLAALFLATGQDVASVVESGSGLTIIETTRDGDLYASTTIPNLIVGSVGGGTRLPSQHECLSILGCAGSGHARKLAEIAGAAVLAGELSLVAALAADSFAPAHAAFGRPAAASPQLMYSREAR